MNAAKICGAAIGAALVGLVGGLVGGAQAASADQDLVNKGAYLTAAGGCAECHTIAGGAAYAGGAAIHSPFGDLYPPNITPDQATGIGDWSDDEFYRAMHEGIGKGGEHLYPAFPYQWYTKITRDDVLAIKAYLFAQTPVHAPNKQNRMMFPFNIRAGLAGWNAVYFKPGEFKPDPAKSEQLNRGAYLVEALGHCGDCHTPKGVGKEPISSKGFSGGLIDQWYAPNISSDVANGVGGWSEDQLFQYLKTGSAPGKGVVAGPMSQVVHDGLSHLTDADVHSIVAYLKATPAVASYPSTQPAAGTGPQAAAGADVYLSHCASCHQLDGRGLTGAVPPLQGNGAVLAQGPENVIRTVFAGHPALNTYAPMPALGTDMTNREIADVTNYVRTAWSNGAPATASEDMAGAIRAKTFSMLEGQGAPDGQRGACDSEEVAQVPPIPDPEHEIAQTLAGVTNSEAIQQAAVKVVAKARQLAPQASQADVVNGLVVAYCKILVPTGPITDPAKRQLLNRFSQLAYTQFVDPEKD